MGFSIPIQQLADRLKLDLAIVARKTKVEVFGAVVQRTPVDTGRARANWNVSNGEIDTTVSDSTDASRAAAEVAKAETFDPAGVAYIANSLPYIRPLEYGGFPNPPKRGKGKTAGGFSKQAPQGMVRVTAAEFEQYVDRAIADNRGKS